MSDSDLLLRKVAGSARRHPNHAMRTQSLRYIYTAGPRGSWSMHGA